MSSQRSEDNQNTWTLDASARLHASLSFPGIPATRMSTFPNPNASQFPCRTNTEDVDVDIVGKDGTPLITAHTRNCWWQAAFEQCAAALFAQAAAQTLPSASGRNYWRQAAFAQRVAALFAQPAAQTLPSALGTLLAAKRSHDDAEESGVQASTKKGKTKCANDSQHL
jgi:hypothetical protein